MRKEKKKRNNEIRELRQKGLTYGQLGRMFNIDKAAVWRIVNRKSVDSLSTG